MQMLTLVDRISLFFYKKLMRCTTAIGEAHANTLALPKFLHTFQQKPPGLFHPHRVGPPMLQTVVYEPGFNADKPFQKTSPAYMASTFDMPQLLSKPICCRMCIAYPPGRHATNLFSISKRSELRMSHVRFSLISVNSHGLMSAPLATITPAAFDSAMRVSTSSHAKMSLQVYTIHM